MEAIIRSIVERQKDVDFLPSTQVDSQNFIEVSIYPYQGLKAFLPIQVDVSFHFTLPNWSMSVDSVFLFSASKSNFGSAGLSLYKWRNLSF